MKFANQVAVITGASSGIGWALAKELARQGAKVGLVARRRENLQALADEIVAAGGTAAFSAADVADREAVISAIRGLGEQLGPIDLLIANAGVGAPLRMNPLDTPAIETMFRVNVFGVIYAVEAVLPQMLQRKKGHIATVSSVAGYKGLPGEWGYTASKAAVNNLTEGLRIQVRDKGIHVTNICPGFVKTPMTEPNKFHMPWLMEADEAARRIARALWGKKKVYNFPWQMGLLMWLAQRMPDWVIARAMQKYNEDPPFPKLPI